MSMEIVSFKPYNAYAQTVLNHRSAAGISESNQDQLASCFVGLHANHRSVIKGASFDSPLLQAKRHGNRDLRGRAHWAAIARIDPDQAGLSSKERNHTRDGIADPCQIAIMREDYSNALKYFDDKKKYPLHKDPVILLLQRLPQMDGYKRSEIRSWLKANSYLMKRFDKAFEMLCFDQWWKLTDEIQEAKTKLIKLAPAFEQILETFPQYLEKFAPQMFNQKIPLKAYEHLVKACVKADPYTLLQREPQWGRETPLDSFISSVEYDGKEDYAIALIRAARDHFPAFFTLQNRVIDKPLQDAILHGRDRLALEIVEAARQVNPAALTTDERFYHPLVLALDRDNIASDELAYSLVNALEEIGGLDELLYSHQNYSRSILASAITRGFSKTCHRLIELLGEKGDPDTLHDPHDMLNNSVNWAIDRFHLDGNSEIALSLIDAVAKLDPERLTLGDRSSPLSEAISEGCEEVVTKLADIFWEHGWLDSLQQGLDDYCFANQTERPDFQTKVKMAKILFERVIDFQEKAQALTPGIVSTLIKLAVKAHDDDWLVQILKHAPKASIELSEGQRNRIESLRPRFTARLEQKLASFLSL